MPTDPELEQRVDVWADRLQHDPNRPYMVRRRKESSRDEFGEVTGDQYDFREMNNIRTQPLGDKEFDRLPEGLRDKSWRFVEVVPKKPGELPSDPLEFLDFGDQIQYKNHWYEVKMINDWDLIQGCKAVFVE